MKHSLSVLCILFVLTAGISKEARSQSVELLAGNTLNGAMNGTILGGAAMALGNSTSFDPLRIGLGLGILGGVGMGAYDVSYGQGNEILVSGLLNDGNNSSIIILLDTFYGIGAGSIIVTSVMLVANEPLLDGLQYGAGIGAIAGFGFGVFDSFVLAKRSSAGSYTANRFLKSASSKEAVAGGLITLKNGKGGSVGFLNPGLVRTLDIQSDGINASVQPKLDLMNLRINF